MSPSGPKLPVTSSRKRSLNVWTERTPMQAMKEWYQEHPDLFHKRPYDRPGCDSRFIMLHDVFLLKVRRAPSRVDGRRHGMVL